MEYDVWFESKTALRVIRELASEAQHSARFGVGFFTIRGWDLVRNFLENKQVLLLVGEVEPSAKQAKKLLIDKILADLNTGTFVNRYQTVRDILERIEEGQMGIFDARSLRHHAKVYIFDEKIAVVGSSNLTVNGLTQQIEAGAIVGKDGAASLARKFDEYFQKAEDLTEKIQEVLTSWLKMEDPWSAYLKFISLASPRYNFKSTYKKIPANYQKHTISSCLQQLRNHRGSMLIASTGLGKTVMAIHIALNLYKQGEIDRTVILGPAQGVEANWLKHIFESNLKADYIGILALDQEEENSRVKKLQGILRLLENDDFNLLVVIDESHLLRNRGTRRKERLAFKRIRKLGHTPGTKVLLMTATPFGKELKNLNNQLSLLPHTSMGEPLIPDYIEGSKAWQTCSTDEFNYLPVVTQMTTSHYEEVVELIEQDIFQANSIENIGDPLDTKRTTRQLIEFVKLSLFSSPMTLQDSLTKIYSTSSNLEEEIGYNVYFLQSQEERQAILTPILTQLEQYSHPGYSIEHDKKLRHLLNIVDPALNNDLKVIIFTERKATVYYLEQALSLAVPQSKIASTVKPNIKGGYCLKNSNEIEELIAQFAPLANDAAISSGQYNVFIGTDAHSVGLNMQDAHIVVNYDISWTPIEPFQRAGRILRFTPTPRTIEIFTIFPGDVDANNELGLEISGSIYQERQALLNLGSRADKLMGRHDQAQEIVKFPVLTTEEALEIDLAEGVREIASQFVDWDALDRATGLRASPLFKHFALASKHQDHVDRLGSDIVAAKEIRSDSPVLLLALTYQQQVHFLIYSPESKRLENSVSLNRFFGLAECNQETSTALANREQIEQLTYDCIQLWVEQNRANPEEVIRKCTLYLVPTAKNRQQEVMDFLELENDLEE